MVPFPELTISQALADARRALVFKDSKTRPGNWWIEVQQNRRESTRSEGPPENVRPIAIACVPAACMEEGDADESKVSRVTQCSPRSYIELCGE